MKKIKKDTAVTHVPSKKSGISLKKLLQWIGWAFIYVFVFYLGNVTGEYVAAQMPVLSFNLPRLSAKLPRITIPKISVSWNTSALTMNKSGSENVPHTKSLFIANTVINMPTEGATKNEQDTFIALVQKNAVKTQNITVSSACVLTPALVSVKTGSVLTVVSSSKQAHQISINGQPSQSLAQAKTLGSPIKETSGAYPIACDGAIVGFYTVQ